MRPRTQLILGRAGSAALPFRVFVKVNGAKNTKHRVWHNTSALKLVSDMNILVTTRAGKEPENREGLQKRAGCGNLFLRRGVVGAIPRNQPIQIWEEEEEPEPGPWTRSRSLPRCALNPLSLPRQLTAARSPTAATSRAPRLPTADMASGAATTAVKIGIIGGTGLDDPDILEGRTEKYVDTPFGKPSDALILGKIKNVDCVLLARHGRQHTIMPSKVNYQANIWALKEEGCSHVIVTTACGSLREEIQPGDIVIIDQFIDRTTVRPQTFYDGSHSCTRGVCHIPMAEPFCPKTREVLIETAKKLGLRCHSKGTMITIEGPRFSSRAESLMFRTWGADVINMTTVPEVVLAKEAGICYASIAMATDFDCWKEHEEAVSVDKVLKILKENANKAKSLLLTTIPQIGSMEWSETLHTLKERQMRIQESYA
ncbi:S-methyl-5'-thioadenosine phosphorylase isoform X2 [Dasypus novemcinctus]|uniref:S-methyl-5'-thioadenosine phosphorylase isoform X2 n=1 Tax=Dasypus novemcinctus TaxID=9361 RepID=UPI0026605772|nr:S-methyl-5'-thioadenosine phosphorylase isoform X3 [Dasypus novemcinctus]